MADLGYDRYVAQGGDWGSAVTTVIGGSDVDHCAAVHVTLAMGARPELDGAPTPRSNAPSTGSGLLPRVGLRATRSSSRRGRSRSATGSSTRRPRKRRGSSRSSGPGWTATATRERADPRRTARQHHALLDQRQRRLLCRASTGRASAAVPRPKTVTVPSGFTVYPKEIVPPGTGMGRSVLHRHPALAGAAPGRALRGVRGARPLRRRHPHVLPPVQMKPAPRAVT